MPSSPPIHHSGVPGNVHGTDIFSPTATITPVGGVSSSTQGNGSSTALSSSSESVLPPVITPSTGGNGPSSSSEPVLPPVITPSTASGGNGSSTVLRSSSESVLRPVITSSTGGNGPPTGLPSSSESVLRPVITPSTGGNGPSTSSEPVLQPVITPSTGAPVGPLRGGNGPIPSTFPGGDGPPSVLSIVNTHSGGNVRPTSSSLVLTTSISEDRGATPQSTSSPSASSKPSVFLFRGIVRVIAGSVTDETTTTGSTVSVTSGILTFPPVRSTTSLSTSLPRPTASTQGVPGVPGVSASGRSGSSINVGALIGGCIGAAIIVLAISIFAFFYFHRRRRNEERRQTSIPAYPNPWLLQASPTPSAGSSPSPGFRPLVMETQADLPTMPMPQPTFLGVGAPLMSETSSASKLPVHRKPVPFWSSPSLDERLVNPWPTSPTSPSAHTHTMMAEDPFADPVRDSASLSDSNSTFREYGMAL